MTQNIRQSIDGDGIAVLLIDVVDRPMNVVTPDFLRELESCVDQLAANAAVRGAIVASAKTSFMAGADIKDMASMFERDEAGFTEDYDPNAEPGEIAVEAEEPAAEEEAQG